MPQLLSGEVFIVNSERSSSVTFGLGDDGTKWTLYSLGPSEGRAFPYHKFFGIRRGDSQKVYLLEQDHRYRIFFDREAQVWDLREIRIQE